MSNRTPQAVVIGAGRTGRGFLAPLLDSAGWGYSFVDKDEALVERLNNSATHVTYFGGHRPEWHAASGVAHVAGSASAVAALSTADLVVTAVGARNMRDVATHLMELRGEGVSAVPVIACENGIDVTRPFRELGYGGPAVQAAVFCTTTLDPEGSDVDLVSEDVASIPFDGNQGHFVVPATFEARDDFEVLMQRKLYTYNTLTAAIGYPGALLGAEWLAEASALPEVVALIDDVRRELNTTLEREFGLTAEEQSAFTKRALSKFRNPAIADPVERNTRDVVRKLGPDERIVAPMRLAHKHGVDPLGLGRVLASAIQWGLRTGEILDVGSLLCWQVLPETDLRRVQALLNP